MIRLVLNGRFLVVVAVEQFGDSFSIWQIRKAAVLSVWWHERAEISGRRGVCVVHILPDYSAILLVSQHSLSWCLISSTKWSQGERFSIHVSMNETKKTCTWAYYLCPFVVGDVIVSINLYLVEDRRRGGEAEALMRNQLMAGCKLG